MSEEKMNETAEMKNESKVQEQIREYSPRVDIWEDEKAVYLTADMPGVSEENVDIDLQGNTLELSGITTVNVPEGFNGIRREYPVARKYSRQFTLGESLDQEAISATMKDGVLTLTLPKSKDVQPRKIIVKRA